MLNINCADCQRLSVVSDGQKATWQCAFREESAHHAFPSVGRDAAQIAPTVMDCRRFTPGVSPSALIWGLRAVSGASSDEIQGHLQAADDTENVYGEWIPS